MLSLPRKTARLEAVPLQNQIIESNVIPDRLTILPPEILIMIWERLFIPHDPDVTHDPQNRFTPLHSRFLYVQRANLYRHVVLNNRGDVYRFAASLEGNETLGGLVRALTIYSPAESGRELTFPYTLELITSRLRRCIFLEAPPSISGLLYTTNARHHRFLSQLVHLTLTFFSHHQSRYFQLVPLSPRLRFLHINEPIVSGLNSIVASTIYQRPKRFPRLERLVIAGHDYRHADLQHLLSFVSARRIILRGHGVSLGLEAIRNPSATIQVLATERDTTALSFDSALLRFKNVQVLELGSRVRVTNVFYTSLAQACRQLKKITVGHKFRLNAVALLQAVPHLPSTLQTLRLDHISINKNGSEREDDWYPGHWRIGCEPLDMCLLVDAVQNRGIDVFGRAVDALEFELFLLGTSVSDSNL